MLNTRSPLGRLSSLKSPGVGSLQVRRPIARRGVRFSSHGASSAPTKSSRKLWIGLGVGCVGFTGLYFGSESFRTPVRHGYFAFQRIATVTVACTRCFSHYRRVLNGKYDTKEEYRQALSECHKTCAEITRKAIERNGGVFIKLGQHIGALTYLFPDEWTRAMIPLQDRCPESSLEDIQRMFLDDTGMTIDQYFDSFDPKPLGTASLAQVHRATLKDTKQEVAVKVQHPSLQEFVPLDVLMTKTVFNLIDYFFKDYPLTWLSEELQNSIFIELDFREEAKNAQKTQKYFRNFYGQTALRVPDVIWDQRRILVMEFLQGARLDDLEYLDRHNIHRDDVSACLSHTFNNMIFTPGVGLHCDPHPGNLAIVHKPKKSKNQKHNFEIILYDHGLYRDVPTDIRRAYSHFWLALIDKDEAKMRKYAYDFAGITDDQFRLFAAAITGRDFENATNVETRRTRDEILNMSGAISEDGLLSDIMVLLHSVPRIVLLILKTNDLTRLLDEKLNNPLGPLRTFLIMATYCARTVYDEGREFISHKYNSRWTLGRFVEEFIIWWAYFRRQSQLLVYDTGMSIRRYLN